MISSAPDAITDSLALCTSSAASRALAAFFFGMRGDWFQAASLGSLQDYANMSTGSEAAVKRICGASDMSSGYRDAAVEIWQHSGARRTRSFAD
ncbi:hypothetical protein J1614_008810 [Plenodomus biglobosus]|nr:hypothetical protein J1614_008810 [Plenodomus biglobosus]